MAAREPWWAVYTHGSRDEGPLALFRWHSDAKRWGRLNHPGRYLLERVMLGKEQQREGPTAR